MISLFGDNSQIMTRVFGIRTDRLTGRQVNFLPEEVMLLDERWVKPNRYEQKKLAANIKSFRGSCSKIEEKYEKEVKNINGFIEFEEIVKSAVEFMETMEVRTEIE